MNTGYGSIAKAFASKSPSYKLEKLCSYYELANLWGRKIHFKPGNRFHEWDIGNGICRTEISFQDNKVIRVQKGKKQVVTEWDFKEHFLTMTTTVDKVVATRYFERAQYFCL